MAHLFRLSDECCSLSPYVREKCGDNIFNTDWSLGLRRTVSRFGEPSGVLS